MFSSSLLLQVLNCAVAAFNPANHGTLAAWWKADFMKANDDEMVNLPDASGNGHDANGVAGKQPIFKPGVLNGLPVLRFNGVDQELPTQLDLVSPYTIVLVASAASAEHRILQSSTYNRTISYNRTGDSVYVGSPVCSDTRQHPGANQWALGTLVIGAKSEWYLNGIDRTDNAGLGGADWGVFHFNGSPSSGEYKACDVAEVIVFSSALTTAQRLAVELYLNAKYALW